MKISKAEARDVRPNGPRKGSASSKTAVRESAGERSPGEVANVAASRPPGSLTTKRGRRPQHGSRWRFLAWGKRGHEKVALSSEERPAIFDEVVVDSWLHVEQMERDTWWMQVGDCHIWVRLDRDGNAKVYLNEGTIQDNRLGSIIQRAEAGRAKERKR